MSISVKEYKNLAVKKKRHKYNAKAVVVDGIKFKSTKEGEYYRQLNIAKKSGALVNFYMQVPFRLPGNITYWLDFVECWKGDNIRHVDTKGVETRVFINKKKQVEEIYGITIEVV